MKIGKPEYIKQAKSLSYDEQQRILSRMAGKLPKRLIKEKLSVDEAIAIQLEIEEEQLQEWRKNWEKIKKLEAKTAEKAPVKAASSKTTTKTSTTKPVAKKPVAAKPAVAAPKQTTAKPSTAKSAASTAVSKAKKTTT